MIGYYVHHQGDGHLIRAATIARHLGGIEVTGLSSRASPEGWAGPWVQLARDDVPQASETADPTAGGALHWAPRGHAGLRERMAQLAAWVSVYTPRLVVVDVSVEVAVLLRAMGVPVVVMGQPGVRDDDAHQLAYRVADAVIAPWPGWADILIGGAAWREKTHAVGAISRFDARAYRAEHRPAGDDRRRVLVLSGRGGTDLTAVQLADAQRATPEWAWTVLGPPMDRWFTDPWPHLCSADVVVTHAGQNAIAEVAAARRAAVVIPQRRPHDEQQTTASALHAARLAIVRPRWPAPRDWPALLTTAIDRGGVRWTRWSSRAGAQRAAEVLRTLALRNDHAGSLCAPR